jgi:hypothetical protein
MYPTKEEIIANLRTPSGVDTQILLDWKQEHYQSSWKNKGKQEKITALARLIDGLVTHRPVQKELSTLWAVQMTPEQITLFMDESNPSIISCLHEIGHIKHGSSELKACTYSIALFEQCFPKERSKLEWKGHMLVKKTCLPT